MYANEPTLLRLSRAAASLLPKGRSTLVRQVARFTGSQKPFLAQVGSRRFLIDLNERVSRTLYLYGSFEPAITSLLAALIPPGGTVLDVGANFGYYTLLASSTVGPAGKVYAFEPDPRNIERLTTVLNANNATNVQHVAEGVFDSVGTVSFHLAADAEDNLGSSSILAGGQGRSTIEITTTTLDIFMTSRGLQSADLMKMDIEGAELQALKGAREVLAAKRIRQILLELHVGVLGRENAQSVVDGLLAAGYHCAYVREDSAVPPSATPAQLLKPLASTNWLEQTNPHLLFTAEPVPGVSP